MDRYPRLASVLSSMPIKGVPGVPLPCFGMARDSTPISALCESHMAKPKKAKDPLHVDMRKFHRSVDWLDLWEHWYADILPSGLPKWRTLKMFCSQFSKCGEQLRFMLYYLGPVLDADPDEAVRYPFVKPLDWKKKRDTGGWYADDTIKSAAKAIVSKTHSIEAIKAAGEAVTLKGFLAIGDLIHKLHSTLGGRLFDPSEDFGENVARISSILRLYSSLADLNDQYQTMFAKSQGINFESGMNSFSDLVAASALAAQQQGGAQSRTELVLSQVVQMIMEKKAKFGLSLPEDVEGKIVEATIVTPPKDSLQ